MLATLGLVDVVMLTNDTGDVGESSVGVSVVLNGQVSDELPLILCRTYLCIFGGL